MAIRDLYTSFSAEAEAGRVRSDAELPNRLAQFLANLTTADLTTLKTAIDAEKAKPGR